MFRTTIYVDEETILALRQLAARQKRSQADLIQAYGHSFLILRSGD